ncbi:YaaR family protein [Dehalobacter sp. DCM]|uniref:YaaR family protein n=1 Tax=Dehalobacter sp. DCM TaxID=2907827 RepID=UPI00308165B7|nr:YaaR family protein [Dehalobacter sp. DCM]
MKGMIALKINGTNQKSNMDASHQLISGKRDSNFSTILSQSRQLKSNELEVFIQRLDIVGKKLSATKSIENLTEFKNLVKGFLQSTFGRSRTMQEDTLWDFRGQPKIMAHVNKINKALEDLGQEVLNTQTEPLKILEKIGEIKGLIIDLLA